MNHHHQSTFVPPTSHTSEPSGKCGSDGCFPTTLGSQPTFSDTSILKIISFSHHQAVSCLSMEIWKATREFILEVGCSSLYPNPLRIREETLGVPHLFSASWNSAKKIVYSIIILCNVCYVILIIVLIETRRTFPPVKNKIKTGWNCMSRSRGGTLKYKIILIYMLLHGLDKVIYRLKNLDNSWNFKMWLLWAPFLNSNLITYNFHWQNSPTISCADGLICYSGSRLFQMAGCGDL